MILVTGATGQLGRHVIAQLAASTKGQRFAATAHDPAKAKPLLDAGFEVRAADFDRPDSLPAALRGVTRLLLISTMAENRLEQHKAVIDAAVTAGVAHIVYTGLAIRSIATSHVAALMESHFQTEAHIRRSGLAYTFLRNTMYVEALPTIIAAGCNGDRFTLPGGNGKVPYALRRELGEAVANVLLGSGHKNATYHLTGADAFGYADIAGALGREQGAPLHYVDIPPAQFQQQMEVRGASGFEIYLTKGTVQDIAEHQYEVPAGDLERLLGRRPADLDTLVRAAFTPSHPRKPQ